MHAWIPRLIASFARFSIVLTVAVLTLPAAADKPVQLADEEQVVPGDNPWEPNTIKAPIIPQEREALNTATTQNDTVRPAKREHMPDLLRVPDGFQITVFARDLTNPRIIQVAPSGDIYVSEREAGRVTLLRDRDSDGRADVVRPVAEGLGSGMSGVHGLAIHDNRLYMVTMRELYVADILPDGELSEPELLRDDLPYAGQHPNRTIAVGPDGVLYLQHGSSTNASPEAEPVYATLLRMQLDGSNQEIFAEGLRNTIGFDWHPSSSLLYGWDHNSDSRGDNWPPEEINHIQAGAHYGWPYCGGDRQVDVHLSEDPPDQSKPEFCQSSAAPVLTYQGHSAGMQYVYYTGSQFPEGYRNDAFVTLRGSWNSNPPVGYEVVRVRHDADGRPAAIEPFASGWLLDDGKSQMGRLTGLAVASDGALLVSNDSHGVVYRIAYTGSREE